MDYKDINFEAKYDGYIWMSEKKTPDVLVNQTLDRCCFEKGNPFVIEGQLYDSVNRKSLSIKYVDGKYYILSFDVEDKDFNSNYEKTYVSNRMGGRMLRFVQHWKDEADEFCEDMESYRPSELVFIGFGETIKEED